MNEIQTRLLNLREIMIKEGIAACIIPGTDPHASEYIADCWKEREWISSFDGSAGTAVVTLQKAGLWTDSRYFLQGAEQLAGSGFDLMKQGLAETLDIVPWLAVELKSGDKVGVNSQMFSINAFASMKSQFLISGIELVSIDLLAQTWTQRPALPLKKLFVFDTKYTGKSTVEKIAELRKELVKSKADVFIMSALDDIAWLFNIRGNDVNYNPVVIAYAIVSKTTATLYIAPEKLTEETKSYLQSQNVETAAYNKIYDDIKGFPSNNAVLVDGAKLNQSLFEYIPSTCQIRNQMSPVFNLKSIKNEIEMTGVRKAMIKDGVALTKFFMWLEKNIETEKLTEVSISEKLYKFRSEQENFVGESFGTIAGYAGHGAIVHYRADEKSDATLIAENILLLDSGGQYLDGTTDITRTITLGKPNEQQKTDFTLVLKGHIALSSAIFPAGTRGSQLDILARKSMWDMGLNYGHGTGHGVGHFLNVHEGPQSIRMDENPTILQVGMILSNEPGMYRANEYGIRTENLIQVIPSIKTEFGQFLAFETLTLFPIDRELIEILMLDSNDVNWIDEYHEKVYNALSEFLNEEEETWLKNKCRSICDLIF